MQILDVAVDDDVVRLLSGGGDQRAMRTECCRLVWSRRVTFGSTLMTAPRCWIWCADRLWPMRLATSTSSTRTSAAAQASSTWFWNGMPAKL